MSPLPTDPAGNTSTGNGANFMLDLTPPSAPTVQAATDLSGVTAAEAEAGLLRPQATRSPPSSPEESSRWNALSSAPAERSGVCHAA